MLEYIIMSFKILNNVILSISLDAIK